MRKASWHVLCLAICCAVFANAQIDTCGGSLGGADYDLTALSLSSGEDYKFSTSGGQITYWFNVCANTLSSHTCTSSQGPARLQISGTVQACRTLGRLPGAWSALSTSTFSQGGVSVTYQGGDQCNSGVGTQTYSVTLQFPCAPDAGVGAITTVAPASGTNPCNIVVTWPSAYGCPVSGESTGLSGGWIFIIILLVCSFVYVVGGCIYKRKKMGTTGMKESCPNIDFWGAIPGLFKDGCAFSWQKTKDLYAKCTGGSSSSSGGSTDYEKM